MSQCKAAVTGSKLGCSAHLIAGSTELSMLLSLKHNVEHLMGAVVTTFFAHIAARAGVDGDATTVVVTTFLCAFLAFGIAYVT
jgi:hypothetical protein